MKLKLVAVLALSWILPSLVCAQAFHGAPPSSVVMTNPLADDVSAAADGRKLFMQSCAQCHGSNLQGRNLGPSLDSPGLKSAKPGEVFWFVTNGSASRGMPSWSQLSKQQRWQIVSFLESRLSIEAKSDGANPRGPVQITCAVMHEAAKR